MEHKLIQGGEQYLPLARSRIKALRAAGMRYASEQFEIDGVSIKIRLVGGIEYITITGGDEGQYLILPANAANPSGVTLVGGVTVPAVSRMGVKGASLKLADHVADVAGAVDWKNWGTGKKLEILTYDHGMTSRYRVNESAQSISGAAAGLYMGGVAIATGGMAVIGACIATFAVGTSKVKRLVFLTRNSTTQVTAYASPLGPSPTWTAIGSMSLTSADDITDSGNNYSAQFLDPFFFDKTGEHGISILSNPSRRIKRLIRCSLSASESGGVVTVACNFATGEHVGAVLNTGYGIPAQSTTDGYVNAGTRTAGDGTDIYTAEYVIYQQAGTDRVTLGGRSGGSTEYVIGADYSSTGEELLLTAYQDVGTDTLVTVTSASYSGLIKSPAWRAAVGATYENNFDFYWSQPAYRISDAVVIPDNYSQETFRYGTTGTMELRINGQPLYEAPHYVQMGYSGAGNIGGTTTTPAYLDTEPGTSKRLVIHDVDMRNQSLVAEEVTQVLTEDRTYSTTLTNTSSARKVAIDVSSKFKVIVGGVEVISLDSVTVPSVTEYLNWSQMVQRLVSQVALRNGSGDASITWLLAEFLVPTNSSNKAGNTASRKSGQFVTSVNGERSRFDFMLTSLSVTHTKTSLTANRIASAGLVLGAGELAKIPLYSAVAADKFRFNPVKVM